MVFVVMNSLDFDPPLFDPPLFGPLGLNQLKLGHSMLSARGSSGQGALIDRVLNVG